jgi:hypothetical protein
MRYSYKAVLHNFLAACIALMADTATAQTNFWQQTNGPYGGIIEALTINNDGHIFAGTYYGGVFRSTDNGNHWSPINTGLTNLFINALAINSAGHIFAGTFFGGGVFRSTDNGDTWRQINTGLTNRSVGSLVINLDGHIFAGTAGDGVFRSVEPTTSVEEHPARIPSSFALEQNYPNPFNPSTTIEYALPKSAHVELKVYDVLGNEVQTLVNGKQPAGRHRVQFDGKGLPGGVYFYRIQAGEFVQTKKLTLLK